MLVNSMLQYQILVRVIVVVGEERLYRLVQHQHSVSRLEVDEVSREQDHACGRDHVYHNVPVRERCCNNLVETLSQRKTQFVRGIFPV